MAERQVSKAGPIGRNVTHFYHPTCNLYLRAENDPEDEITKRLDLGGSTTTFHRSPQTIQRLAASKGFRLDLRRPLAETESTDRDLGKLVLSLQSGRESRDPFSGKDYSGYRANVQILEIVQNGEGGFSFHVHYSEYQNDYIHRLDRTRPETPYGKLLEQAFERIPDCVVTGLQTNSRK